RLFGLCGIDGNALPASAFACNSDIVDRDCPLFPLAAKIGFKRAHCFEGRDRENLEGRNVMSIQGTIHRKNCRAIYRICPWFLLIVSAGALLEPLLGISTGRSAIADEPALVRNQAVINLTFDEASGDALDSAAMGSTKDNAVSVNGAARVKS